MSVAFPDNAKVIIFYDLNNLLTTAKDVSVAARNVKIY